MKPDALVGVHDRDVAVPEPGGMTPRGVADLSPQQRACLELVAKGYSSKQIGRMRGLSPATVDNYIFVAKQALGTNDRFEAARLVSDALGQDLPLQPPVVVSVFAAAETASTIGGRLWRYLVRFIPPIGGRSNDLTAQQRWVALGNIYFFSAITFVVAIIVIKVSLRILS